MRFATNYLKNPLKEKLKKGELVVGTWINAIRDPVIAKIVGTAGFDYVLIDLEHSGITMDYVMNMSLMARECGVAPLVRPYDPTNIQMNSKILDVGPVGLVIPHVTSIEEAKNAVNSLKFFDGGTRGTCARSANSGWEKFNEAKYKGSDEQTVCVIQFENKDSIDMVDDILSVSGIDVAIVGRGDLAHSMGLSGRANSPEVTEQVERVIVACNKHEVTPGLLINSIDEAKIWMEKGMRFLTYSNEAAILLTNYQSALESIRSTI